MQGRNIVVVGAGPVGTVAALACARFGHRVALLEAQERIDDSPRASTTQPPTLEILAELGLIDETAYPFVVQTEQHKLANMAIGRLRCMPNAEVLLGCAVSGISQNESRVTVTAGERHFAADYVIGCDGGRSTLRKGLDIEFEGYTWPERFLVVTTQFDFEAALGCCLRNYMADPEEWTNLFKEAGDALNGRFRPVYNTWPHDTAEG